MYSSLQQALKYIHYYLRASGGKGHGIHSPFVFDFITKVMNDTRVYPAYAIAEALRKRLLNNHAVLTVEDFGAGSAVSKTNQRSVSSIAKNAAKPAKYGQLLFRMVKYYRPSVILELGTSLGITTTYLSLAGPDAKLVTMEGAKEIAALAKENFKNTGLENIETVEGNFDSTLSSAISRLPAIDFVFIDGNHRQEPAERYFQQLLSRAGNDSIFVFDDIHWSREMETAWKTIRNHPAVTCSIDLFFTGIIFFRKEFKEKQEFVIRF